MKFEAEGREFAKFLRSLEQFFLTVGQNNFSNKIPLFFAERDENGHRWILQIRNCGPRQAGKYSAVARNRNGTCTRSWHLHLVHPNEITKSPNPNGDESEVNKSQQIESRDQEQPSTKEALKPSAAVVFQKEVRLWQF